MTEPTPSTNQPREPEQLLEGVNRSIFGKALLISTLLHILFAGLTSFSLYAGWMEHGMFLEGYGIVSRSDIQKIEQEAAQQARQQEQEERLQKELDARRSQENLEVTQEGEATEEDGADPEPTPAEQTTPQAPEIEPLPPKRNFSLDDLPGLSD